MKSNVFLGFFVLILGLVFFMIGLRKRGAALVKELQVSK